MILTSSSDLTEQYLTTTMIIFIATSILNIAWLFTWHYDYIVLSTILMAVFLALLLFAVSVIPSESLLIKSTFSLYAAWLSVAFIANVSIMIVHLQLDFFLQKEVLWYILIISMGLLLVTLLLFTSRNVVYGLVFIWAYVGIFMKHKSQTGYFISSDLAFTYTGLILLIILLFTVTTFVINDFKLFQK